jgi:diguanylate cyclase (GGDEF)-like protein
MVKKSNWGILLFGFGVILLIGGYWILGLVSQNSDPTRLSRIFFYMGVASGIIIPILGYLSYPRVHNLKVFLVGCLIGIGMLAYFLLGQDGLLTRYSSVPLEYSPGMYLLMVFVVFLSAVVPTFLKHRYTKILTISLLVLELTIIYVLRFVPITILPLRSIRLYSTFHWIVVTPAGATILVLLLSVYVLKLKFHLGGILGGAMVLLTGGWYLGYFYLQWIYSNTDSVYVEFDQYVFSITAVFLGIGILVHWMVRMQHRANYDPLLRVYNREYCEEILSEKVSVRVTPPFGIAIVDIDKFKKINDTYGHKVGDDVLIHVARILTNELVPEGIVCRYGGDEFVIFFPRKDSTKVKTIMDKARKSVKNTLFKSGKRGIKVTLSIGISHRKNTGQSLREVLKIADKALYRSKKQGRDQVRYSRGK